MRELFGRTTAFLADLRPPAHGDVVLFVHGGSLRTLLAARTGVAVERLGWGPVRNATVVHVPLAPRPPSAETPRHVLTATN